MMKKILTLALIIVSYSAFSQPSNNTLYNNMLGTNSEPVLYKELSLSTHQLLTANLQFSKDNNQQKILVAPFKILKQEYVDVLSETAVNISQKNGITTLGLGIGYDNSSPYGSKATKILLSSSIKKPTLRSKKNEETLDEYMIYEREFKEYIINSIYKRFYENLTESCYKISLGYNIQLFEVISGDNADINNNGLIDNFYTIKSHNVFAGLSTEFVRRTGIDANIHYSYKRPTAEEKQEMVSYVGGSFSFGLRIIDLNRNYETSEDYLKSLFIPSIGFGCSFEYQKCSGDLKFCEDNIKEQLVITPFVDIKINPKNQFRLGVPIKKTVSLISQGQLTIGPFIQYCFQISGLN